MLKHRYQHMFNICILGIKHAQLKDELSQGMRLQKPTLCPEEISKIMGSCFNELPEERPTFSNLAIQFEQAFKQIKRIETQENDSGAHFNFSIESSILQHSKDMEDQYVDMKSINKKSQKRSKHSTIKQVNSVEESQWSIDVPDGILTKKSSALVYVNACFEPTESIKTNAQVGNENDLKLNDPDLYTSMSHALPLMDVLTDNNSSYQQLIKSRRSSIQDEKAGFVDGKALKATQSCNPLYMVMDHLQPHSPKTIDAQKRKTISYI